MLSPGQHHLRIPRDLTANLRFRRRLLDEAARAGEAGRQAIRDACKADILFYINAFVWQYNPKKPPADRVGPFVTWGFQERALLDRPETTGKRGILWCYEKGRTAVVEKSREMGASWLFLITEDWLSGFHDYTQSLNISRDQDSVDSRSPDSLFWKIRFMHEHQPGWLMGKIVQQSMYFRYTRSESVITGEASTGTAGVGGRASVIFIDEFPLIKDAAEVRRRTANTADCRFFNGTHSSPSSEMVKLVKSPEVTKIRMHWSEHPYKNRGLYRYNPDRPTQPEILDKNFVYRPQCPECLDTLDVKVGELSPCCDRPAQEFKFVLDGRPFGGPFPGLRSPWYDWKCLDIGDDRAVAMELDIDPQGSVTQYFDALMIDRLVKKFCRPPDWEGEIEYDPHTGKNAVLVKRKRGMLRLWGQLRPNGLPALRSYLGGIDCARGTGATPSCLSVGALGEKVLEYANPFIDAKEFAVWVFAACTLFLDEDGRGPKLIWEKQGPGEDFGVKLLELGYRNVYLEKNEDGLVYKTNPRLIPGFYPSPKAKSKLLADYKEGLKSFSIINRSERALNECLLFTYDQAGEVIHGSQNNMDDPSRGRVSHADIAMADALMFKLMKAAPKVVLVAGEEPVSPNSIAGRMKFHEDKRRQEDAWA